ncbi:MAG: GNAT family N-acetyltransferase [Clostridiales bacterium]|nr:GNAT family N-acetyltransferase [Clostridiales bacterium]
MSCYQAVYTKKEKLPITGLYRLDGKKQDGVVKICPLNLEYLDIVTANYHTVDDTDYMKERIEKGWMFGAFIENELAGFAGMHTEGSIGMLEVLPQYRGRHIGKALETYMINLSLEHGMIPYGQVADGNEVSTRLQETLGLCFSKTMIYWMGKKL